MIDSWTLLVNITSISSKSIKEFCGTSTINLISSSSDIFVSLRLNTHKLYFISPASAIISDVFPQPGGPNNR